MKGCPDFEHTNLGEFNHVHICNNDFSQTGRCGFKKYDVGNCPIKGMIPDDDFKTWSVKFDNALKLFSLGKISAHVVLQTAMEFKSIWCYE